jgi:hypothetical protein
MFGMFAMFASRRAKVYEEGQHQKVLAFLLRVASCLVW